MENNLKHKINVNSYLDVPKIHEIGFFKQRIPTDLYNNIIDLYKMYRYYVKLDNESTSEARESWTFSTFLQLNKTPHLKQTLANDFNLYLSHIMKLNFENPQFYGFRIYLNKSKIRMHRDRLDLNIGAILQIDQWGEPWPLDIEDHDGKKHEILLSAGEMVVYESSRISHGRLKEFNGIYYTNLLFHASFPNLIIPNKAHDVSLLDKKYHL
jgi:prolyl 4-hydroxylase